MLSWQVSLLSSLFVIFQVQNNIFGCSCHPVDGRKYLLCVREKFDNALQLNAHTTRALKSKILCELRQEFSIFELSLFKSGWRTGKTNFIRFVPLILTLSAHVLSGSEIQILEQDLSSCFRMNTLQILVILFCQIFSCNTWDYCVIGAGPGGK